MPRRRSAPPRPAPAPGAAPATLRIVGGELRGRKLLYAGDPRVRPMKDRVREAAFNLVGPSIRGCLALDLFAGTGAVGLEALSRGAARAVFIERHHPTATLLRRNIAALGVGDRAEVHVTDAFAFTRSPAGPAPSVLPRLVHLPDDVPWAAFVSPPWAFFTDRREAMLELIGSVIDGAPPGSLCVVEADSGFDPGALPEPAAWNVRRYPPALVCLFRKTASP